MAYIALSTVFIVFNKDKWYNVLLVSGFLLTQAIFGMCIVTWFESLVRASEGFVAPTNEFILHNIVSEPYTALYRVIFAIIGIGLIYLMINKRRQ